MPALPPSDAVDYARYAAFTRGFAVAYTPEFQTYEDTLVDIRRPKCKRTKPSQFRCEYRFTIESNDGWTLYDEHGRVRVTRHKHNHIVAKLFVTDTARLTRG